MTTPLYTGRFAPSPSGPLHMGSLVTALGSYLQAKANNGHWLVRIEDIDPPREQPGADTLILKTLEAHALHWDDKVIYQSQRSALYDEVLNYLLNSGQAYYCRCTRQQIQADGGYYQGRCRSAHHSSQMSAIRLKNDHPLTRFFDTLHGQIDVDKAMASEDFIIRRRDGLYAYNLAVVIDDMAQGVTEIVRGADLIEPTVRQLALFDLLHSAGDQLPFNKQATRPGYLHLPLVRDNNGQKLSKQNHAPPLNDQKATMNMLYALRCLGLKTEEQMKSATPFELLQWASAHWHPQNCLTGLDNGD